MTITRYAAQRDSNEDAIVRALVHAGCRVQRLSAKGVPDLLVGTPAYTGHDGLGAIVLLEVKTAKGALTDDQDTFFEIWAGYPVYVVRSVDDALKAVGRL